MATTGLTFGGTAANVNRDSWNPWSSVNNALSSGSTASVDDDETCYLTITNFGFSIPTGATIDGITVEIRKSAEVFGGFVASADHSVQLLDSTSTVVGDNKADTITEWSASLATVTYGGSADTWTASLDDVDINSSNFGVRIAGQVAPSASYGGNYEVDYIKVNVTYTEAGTTISVDTSTVIITPQTVDILGAETISVDLLTVTNTPQDVTIINDAAVQPSVNIQRYDGLAFGASEDTWDVTITAVDTSKAFVRMANTSRQGSGTNGSAANMLADDIGITVAFVDSTTVSLTRETTAINSDQIWQIEIIEFIGADGSENEFIIRQTGTIAFTTSELTSTATISGISNIDNCVPFLTGQRTAETSSQIGSGIHNLSFTDASTLEGSRSITSTSVSTLSYVVVEFTGSNWTIGHRQDEQVLEGTNTYTFFEEMLSQTTALNTTDMTTAFVEYGSTSNDNDDGLSSMSIGIRLATSSTVEIKTASGGISPDPDISMQCSFHVIKNDNFSVQHSQPADPGSADSLFDISITTVTDTAQTSVHCSMTSSGNGTAHSRYQRGYRLKDASTVEWRGHRTGNNLQLVQQVVEWPEETAAPTDETITIDLGTVTVTTNGVDVISPEIISVDISTVTIVNQTVTVNEVELIAIDTVVISITNQTVNVIENESVTIDLLTTIVNTNTVDIISDEIINIDLLTTDVVNQSVIINQKEIITIDLLVVNTSPQTVTINESTILAIDTAVVTITTNSATANAIENIPIDLLTIAVDALDAGINEIVPIDLLTVSVTTQTVNIISAEPEIIAIDLLTVVIGVNTVEILEVLSTGLTLGGTATSTDAGPVYTAWINVNDALIDDVNTADIDGVVSSASDYLDITNFGFNIDSDATITGIEVEIKRGSFYYNGATRNVDRNLKLLDSTSTEQGTDKADTTTIWPDRDTPSTVIYGGSTDNWSAGLDPTDINSSNFGIRLSTDVASGSSLESPDVFYIKVNVYYIITDEVITIDLLTVDVTTLVAGINEIVPIDLLSVTNTVQTVDINESTIIAIDLLTVDVTNQTVNVNEVEIVPIDLLSVNIVTNTVAVNEAEVISIDLLTVDVTTLVAGINEIVPIDLLTVNVTTNDIDLIEGSLIGVSLATVNITFLEAGINEIVPIDLLSVSIVNQSVNVNEGTIIAVDLLTVGITTNIVNVKADEAIVIDLLSVSNTVQTVDINESTIIAIDLLTVDVNTLEAGINDIIAVDLLTVGVDVLDITITEGSLIGIATATVDITFLDAGINEIVPIDLLSVNIVTNTVAVKDNVRIAVDLLTVGINLLSVKIDDLLFIDTAIVTSDALDVNVRAGDVIDIDLLEVDVTTNSVKIDDLLFVDTTNVTITTNTVNVKADEIIIVDLLTVDVTDQTVGVNAIEIIAIDLLTVDNTVQTVIINANENIAVDVLSITVNTLTLAVVDVVPIDLLVVSINTLEAGINDIIAIDLLTIDIAVGDVSVSEGSLISVQTTTVNVSTNAVNVKADDIIAVDLLTVNVTNQIVDVNAIEIIVVDLLTVDIVVHTLAVNEGVLTAIIFSHYKKEFIETSTDVYSLTTLLEYTKNISLINNISTSITTDNTDITLTTTNTNITITTTNTDINIP